MHRSYSSLKAVNLLENTAPNSGQPSIHDWLAQTIDRLSQQACATETTCRASTTAGCYHITHGQTTHHLSAYETYRFLQSILWLYDLE